MLINQHRSLNSRWIFRLLAIVLCFLMFIAPLSSYAANKEEVVQKNGSWYYVVNGQIQTNYTGVRQNSNGWWRIEKGKVNFNFKGFAENEYGWWYIEGGKVQFGRNDVIQGVVKGTNAWWHVVDGKVTFDNTVAQNSNGWWVIQNGKVNFNYTGFAENQYGWWYCSSGKVQFGKNDVIQGTVKGTNAWWHVIDGKVTFDTTVAQNSNGWWRIESGKVNFNFNGLAQNEHGWWYLKDGKVDFNYKGFAKNEYGWWYLEGGKVQFGRYDVIKGSVNGQTGLYIVRDGKVDLSYSGTTNTDTGTWKIKDGKVNLDYTKTETIGGKQYIFVEGQAKVVLPDVYRKYSDNTCTIQIYKQWHYDSWCYLAHIQTKDYKRFGSASANGYYNKGTETTYHAGKRLGAILCVNGDFAYQPSEPHPAIRKGVVEAKGSNKVYVCEAYNANTGMLFNANEGYCYPGTNTKCSTYTIQQAADKGLITDTFTFGAAGLNNRIVQGSNSGPKRPRTLIGTTGAPGDLWLVVTAGDYSDGVSQGLTGYEGSMLLRDLGCTFGGHLDGGGSSTMYFKGELLVKNEGTEGRAVADFVYVK